MGVQFSKCYVCKHFISGGELEDFTCQAYPEGFRQILYWAKPIMTAL